ncbi:MAG TPA: hypothetical protein VH143_02490 [Kofleriaceae bacterium]|jgi:hypothetical protein|nr:hypothetical protein [Kofleriaceae bacterium]
MKLAIAIVLLTAGIARADSAADVDKFLKWFDGFADLAQADQASCPKMGTDLNKSIDDNKPILDGAKRAMDSGDEIPGDAAQHMIDTGKRLAAAVQKCKSDAGVIHALTRLPGRNAK